MQTTATFVDAWQTPNSACENEVANDQELELTCSDDIKAKAKEICNKLLANEKFNDCLTVRKSLTKNYLTFFHE